MDAEEKLDGSDNLEEVIVDPTLRSTLRRTLSHETVNPFSDDEDEADEEKAKRLARKMSSASIDSRDDLTRRLSDRTIDSETIESAIEKHFDEEPAFATQVLESEMSLDTAGAALLPDQNAAFEPPNSPCGQTLPTTTAENILRIYDTEKANGVTSAGCIPRRKHVTEADIFIEKFEKDQSRRKGKRKSRYKGVIVKKYFKKKEEREVTRWYANIRANCKLKSLGAFKSEEEAARAYDAAAFREFGTKAKLNFPASLATFLHERQSNALYVPTTFAIRAGLEAGNQEGVAAQGSSSHHPPPFPPKTRTASSNAPPQKKKHTSKYIGVWKPKASKDLWYAGCQKNYERYFIGSYDHEESAARAYDKFVRKLYGDKAVCNFPPENEGAEQKTEGAMFKDQRKRYLSRKGGKKPMYIPQLKRSIASVVASQRNMSKRRRHMYRPAEISVTPSEMKQVNQADVKKTRTKKSKGSNSSVADDKKAAGVKAVVL